MHKFLRVVIFGKSNFNKVKISNWFKYLVVLCRMSDFKIIYLTKTKIENTSKNQTENNIF